MNWALVFLGGGLGSLLRYSLGIAIYPYNKSGFPYATFLANIISCFIAGILFQYFNKASSNEYGKLLLITGFCGGFSTFSTLSLETLVLFEKNQTGLATAYIFLSIALGLLSVWLGVLLTK